MRRPWVALAAVAAAVACLAPGAGVAAQAPRRGGTLVYRLLSPEPGCLNVLLDACAGPPATFWIADRVLAKPFEVIPDFTYRPQLATATFTRQRPFTLTYRIRPDATWSDGQPVTARDFIFTLRAIRKYGGEDLRKLHAVVRSIHAVDPKTVKVVLKPRSSVWRDLFGNVLPEHALRGLDLSKVWTTAIDNPRTGAPIGSGPFLVERWDRGRQLVLRRNPRYRGPHTSYLDRIVLEFSPTVSDPIAALQRGDLDIAAGVPLDLFPAVRREPGIRVVTTPSVGLEHLDLQFGPAGHPALDNKLVRRAIAYGIDRRALARQIYGAVDLTTSELDSLVLIPQSPYYAGAWSSYSYRPARARALLEQAGCQRGSDGIYSCGGLRLSLRFVTNAGNVIRAKTLPLVQQQLRRVGVDVVQVYASGPEFFGHILPEGTFDAAMFSWIFSPGSSWSDVYGCGGFANYTRYCQRLVTAKLDEAGRILDADQQAGVLNSADALMARDVPSIPLFQLVSTAALRSDVRNYVLHGFDQLWNAENWWLDR